ncbi:hypothetical protein TNCV_2908861 [Trichonephila clavipes]|nr:hypothetical protein TNCV_2908861 [Trichonephila clavipes]
MLRHKSFNRIIRTANRVLSHRVLNQWKTRLPCNFRNFPPTSDAFHKSFRQSLRTANTVLSHRLLTANGKQDSHATSRIFPPTSNAYRSSHLDHASLPPPLSQSGDYLS